MYQPLDVCINALAAGYTLQRVVECALFVALAIQSMASVSLPGDPRAPSQTVASLLGPGELLRAQVWTDAEKWPWVGWLRPTEPGAYRGRSSAQRCHPIRRPPGSPCTGRGGACMYSLRVRTSLNEGKSRRTSFAE